MILRDYACIQSRTGGPHPTLHVNSKRRGQRSSCHCSGSMRMRLQNAWEL